MATNHTVSWPDELHEYLVQRAAGVPGSNFSGLVTHLVRLGKQMEAALTAEGPTQSNEQPELPTDVASD